MSRYIDADAYAAEMKQRQDALKELMDHAEAMENWEMYDGLSRAFSVFVEAKLTLDNMQTVDAVPVDYIKALLTDYVQRSKALQGRAGYMYTLYAIALENLVQSFDYDNAIVDEMKTERNCADGERKEQERE